MPINLSEEDQIKLIAASADVVRTAIEHFSRFDEIYGDSWYRDGSPASVFQNAASKLAGPSGTWQDDFSQRLTERCLIYITGSRNYLASIYALIDGHPTGPGVAPVARCILEACGKVKWLLDNGLNLRSHARERVARLLLDEADDASRKKTLAAGLRTADSPTIGRQYRTARNAIAKPGYFRAGEIVLDKSGDATVCNEAFLSSSQFADLAREAVDPQSEDTKYVYGYISTLVHPTMFAYLEAIGGDGALFCAKMANYATLAFYNQLRIYSAWTQLDETESPGEQVVREKHNALNSMIADLSP